MFDEEGFKRTDLIFLGEDGKYTHQLDNAVFFMVGQFAYCGSTLKGLHATYLNPQFFAQITQKGAERMFGTTEPHAFMMFVTSEMNPREKRFNSFILLPRDGVKYGKPKESAGALNGTYAHEFKEALKRMPFDYDVKMVPVKKDEKDKEISDDVLQYVKEKVAVTIKYGDKEIANGVVNGNSAQGSCQGDEKMYTISLQFPSSKKSVNCSFHGEQVKIKSKETTLEVKLSHYDFVRLPFLPNVDKDYIKCTSNAFTVQLFVLFSVVVAYMM
jgi:hypothetical protein